jgi:lipid-A-disaccharide synthase
VHARLGGPPCIYVGHPLIERISDLRPNEANLRRRDANPPVLLLLPGSRRSEIDRLFGTFAAALRLVQQRYPALDVVLPTVPSLAARLRQTTADWPMQPRITADDAEKHAAFRSARAALAASGTVTLELALAGVPTVAAYRIGAIEAAIVRALVRQRPLSVILANLVLGERVVPEFLQEECTPQALASALTPLLGDTAERRAQLDAFARLDAIMGLGLSPSGKAAEAVLTTVTRARAGMLPNPADVLSTAAGGSHA